MTANSFPENAVNLVPNAGWDQRILVFQYERLVTAFAVLTQRYVVLIDSLINPASALVMWDAVGQWVSPERPLVVINTHADWDHCWGNQVFSGPDAIYNGLIIGHEQCRARLLERAAQAELHSKQHSEPALYSAVRIEPPHWTFRDQCTIAGGDLTLRLLPTPGHTVDHLAVFIPEISTLFAGDAAELPLPFVDLEGDPAANLARLQASLDQMLALEPQTVLYCHAIGQTTRAVLDQNQRYFAELAERVRNALLTGTLAAQSVAGLDLAALIDYPLSAVPGSADLSPDELAFYAEAHQMAITATWHAATKGAAD